MNTNYIQNEINQHKMNINNLSMRLINTFDINEEIPINNEIKKETEILISLLNIKKNSLMNPMFSNNNMNFMNPMMNQNNNLINNQMNTQQQLQEQIKQMKEQEELNKTINIEFEFNGNVKFMQCKLGEKLGNVFERFRQKIKVPNLNFSFIFNGLRLNPNILVKDSGLREYSNKIQVFTQNDMIGG